MGLETGTYVDDLVTSNPDGAADDIKKGDDHLRLIKSVLKATFPNATKAFRFESVLTKTTTYPVVVGDARALILGDASSGAFSITLPLGSTVFAGYSVIVMKSDSGSNDVTVDGNGAETINGTATRTLSAQYQGDKNAWDGSEWKVVSITTALVNIVEDITPQLGGNLDVNGKEITSASDGNVVINPDGTGVIQLSAKVEVSGILEANGVLETNAKLQVDDAVTTPAEVLTSSSNAVALSMTGANKKTLTLDEDTTITVSGEVADQVIELWITQGSSGGTAAWSGVDKWLGGTAPTLSTTEGQINIIILASASDGSTIVAQHLGVAS